MSFPRILLVHGGADSPDSLKVDLQPMVAAKYRLRFCLLTKHATPTLMRPTYATICEETCVGRLGEQHVLRPFVAMEKMDR